MLAGYRILVVEDEYFVAADIEDALTRAGADVIGPVSHMDEALLHVDRDEFDLAVLDINLGHDLAYPVADALLERGVPFVFATAYQPSEIPVRYRRHRLVPKPYDTSTLLAGLADAANSLGPRQSG
ncbi:response regulator [Enterovirga sp.]|uniref:response regulator n=1 Tax=Enterovirga sp. TaxID=2026350 RepID=UPI00261860D9|nr:response regulator [Enterovirga sp.]